MAGAPATPVGPTSLDAGREVPEYLEQASDQLYVVSHLPGGRVRGSVVLAGPMTLERSHSYLTWVRWARHLAGHGYAAYRFDYRGVGESTGDFARQTFQGWEADVHRVAALARARSGGPLVVCGLRLGALLGQRVPGAAGLLAWEPPPGGQAMLTEMLRRKLASDYVEQVGERKTREAYIAELEAGATVEVEGYPWSEGLWQSARAYPFLASPRMAIVHLDGRPPDRVGGYSVAVPIPRPAFWLQGPHLVPDLEALFAVSLERLAPWTASGALR